MRPTNDDAEKIVDEAASGVVLSVGFVCCYA